MRLLLSLFAACGISLLAACASPEHRVTAPFQDVDADTKVSVSEKPDGFLVAVYYSRYQFIPNQGPIALDCRKRLLEAASAEAKRRQRPVAVDEDRIEMSTGRNIVTGSSTCIATLPITWGQS